MSLNKARTLQNASKLVQQGRLREALAEYREILRADPGDIATLNVVGDLYAKVGETDEAVKVFLQIVERYLKERGVPKAIATLKKAAKVAPNSVEVGLKLGSLYLQQNLPVEAQQHFLAAAEQYLCTGQNEEAFSLYQEVIQLDPANTALQIRIAEAYLRAQEPAKASELFVAAADQLGQQLKHEEALKTYLQALKASPNDRRALTSAINLYLRRAETRPAEALLRHLLKDHPNDPVLLNLLTRVHQVGHDLEVARQAVSETDEPVSEYLQYQVELVSTCGRAYATFFTAASELHRQGRYEEALQTYLKALRIKPESWPATIAAVNLYLHRGEVQAALKLVRQSLQLLPDNAELLSLLGYIYCEAKDFDAAVQAIGRAVTLDPGRFQELLNLASYMVQHGDLESVFRPLDYVNEILCRQNEEARAIPILREALRRDARHPGALERLAAIYTRIGDKQNLFETLRLLAEAAGLRGEREIELRTVQQLIELEAEVRPGQPRPAAGNQNVATSLPAQPLPADEDLPSSMIVMITDTDEPPPSHSKPVPEEVNMPYQGPSSLSTTAPRELADLSATALRESADLSVPYQESADLPVPYFPEYHLYDSLTEPATLSQPREMVQYSKVVKELEVVKEAEAPPELTAAHPAVPIVEEEWGLGPAESDFESEVTAESDTAETEVMADQLYWKDFLSADQESVDSLVAPPPAVDSVVTPSSVIDQVIMPSPAMTGPVDAVDAPPQGTSGPIIRPVLLVNLEVQNATFSSFWRRSTPFARKRGGAARRGTRRFPGYGRSGYRLK